MQLSAITCKSSVLRASEIVLFFSMRAAILSQLFSASLAWALADEGMSVLLTQIATKQQLMMIFVMFMAIFLVWERESLVS